MFIPGKRLRGTLRIAILLTALFAVSYYIVVTYTLPKAPSSPVSHGNKVSLDHPPPAPADVRGKPEALSKGGNSRPPPKHTVALQFKGRIGNLMFMYASLMGIADNNNLRPVIAENFELLNYFQLSSEKVKNYGSGRKLYREKSGLSYEKEVMKLGGENDFLLDGYFQSWRYFKDIEPLVRKEFTFKPEVRNNAQRQIDDVTRGKCSAPSGGCVYIGVHVRRGDMVHVKKFVDYGYISADKDYLERALDHFREKFPKRAHFVVVSDEPAWCKENLGGSDVSVVTSRNPPHLDLAIVASLNHTVMTVGSYGWWGAWLAGGDIVYYKGYPRPGTTLYKLMNQTDYRYPGSIAL